MAVESVILTAANELAQQDPTNPFPVPDVCNMAQVLFLTAMYAYVLFIASNLISDGSELLMLVPSLAPVVGSIVLPILGAVPDGMMVLFSGLGPDAQSQVSVGVGALAGSTVMLLTLPWYLAVLAGRVNLIEKDGEVNPNYNRPANGPDTWDKLMPPGNASLTGTGIGYGPAIQDSAKVMLITLVGYLVIQIPAFLADVQPKPVDITHTQLLADQKREAAHENFWALVGLVVCVTLFIWNLVKQWNDAQSQGAVDDAIAETTVKAMKEGTLTLRGAMASFRERNWNTLCKKKDLEQVLMNKESMDEIRRMCKVLAPFFAHYDINGDNTVDFEEFRMIFKDVNENLSRDAQYKMFEAADTDGSGNINFEEFVACLMSFSLDPATEISQQEAKPKTHSNPAKYIDEMGSDAGDEEEAEEEDMPEDLADLDPEEQQKRIKFRAFSQMGAGTFLVLVFSDPMVDLLSAIGDRTGVSPFYISFVLAPLASNASELIAAYNYAKKRTKKSITTSLSTLEGAAIMNNTFCLGIFLALVYFKNLAWEFSAETISIMTIQIIIGVMALSKKVQRLLDAYLILSLYPLCLALVWVLENKCGFD